ncbi:CPBP family intramembrane metalloprotease [Gemella sanguinis]|jgi:CAAX amino terminal protease family protein|uniref:CPBP family intramembrane glutamic endopeptidase n=1 Tax=Gemella sanguinis TaxID=84135 RepID=UPI00352C9A6E
MNLLRSNALKLYLLGTLGQIALVCIVVFFLRQSGTTVDYTTTNGIVAIIAGGISSAQWGTIVAIKYKKIDFKTVMSDFFRVKQSYKNYLLAIFFLSLNFLYVLFDGNVTITLWYIPIIMFVKHIAFGGLEEIGWRYLFQPLLQERLSYIISTVLTFIAWGTWHFLFFYIDGSLAQVSVISFLVGLLTNSFLLSALYNITNNLWICAMTHSLINVCSQIFEGENTYVSYLCKVIVIVLAIILSNRAIERNNRIK